MSEKLTPGAVAMCEPCVNRDGNSLCTLGWVTRTQQNQRAQEGYCGDAARQEEHIRPAARVFVIGKWVFQRPP